MKSEGVEEVKPVATCSFRGYLRYTEFDYCVLPEGHRGPHEFPNGTTWPLPESSI